MKDNSKFSKFKAFTKGALFGPEEENEQFNEGAESNNTYGDYENGYSSGYSFEDVNSSSYSGSSYSTYSSGSDLGSSFDSAKSSSSNIYKMGTSKPKFKLSILRLEKLEDAVKVADNILSGSTITLVDFQHVQKDVMRRIIDFLDGVRYTCGAQMENVADYTYVVVPKDVELTGDLFNKIDTTNLN